MPKGKSTVTPAQWAKARTQYIQGGVTYGQLADKLGVHVKTVQRKAAQEKWTEACSEVARRVSAEAVVAEVVDQIVLETIRSAKEAVTFHLELTGRLGNELRAKLQPGATKTIGTMAGPLEIPFLNGPSDFREVATTMDKLVAIERLTHKLDEREQDDGGTILDAINLIEERTTDDTPDDD